MIWLDVTKTKRAGHSSGLTRVTSRLRAELGEACHPCTWDEIRQGRMKPAKTDWYLTAEVFSPAERKGFTDFLSGRPCRFASIYHDAIPLKHPQITWPKSVARHPAYLMLLHGFDRILAVSKASKDELSAFWSWQHRSSPPPIEALTLGADAFGTPRVLPSVCGVRDDERPRLLCVGIIEPRKQQAMLLDAIEALKRENLPFELHFVGRVNPHFGKPVLKLIRAAGRANPGRVTYHGAVGDDELICLYRGAHATLVPSLAEGCGLPLLESLWQDVPCVCSALPSLMENAAGGGCLTVPSSTPGAWASAIRQILTAPALRARLAAEAAARPLATWSDTARQVRSFLDN